MSLLVRGNGFEASGGLVALCRAMSGMPDLMWNQPTVPRMSISSTFFSAVISCCLEKTLPRPEIGLMRLNCGMMGLRL